MRNPLPPPIATGGLMLHIGPQKTGSTALQHALDDNRAPLAEHGVRYAGDRYRPARAGWAVLRQAPQGRALPPPEAWDRLAEDCRAHPHVRICLSNEDLARGDAGVADTVVRSLDPARVHLVYVVRPLDRLLPSQWQEVVKARATLPYEEWLRVVLADRPDAPQWRNVWQPQDVAAILDRWAHLLPPERVTLICVDGSDRELLPRAFESLLGLPSGLLAPDPTRSNRSLTFEQTELLRAVNQTAVAEGWTGAEYWRLIQQGALRGLAAAPVAEDSHPIPPLPAWATDRLVELSTRQRDAVLSSGAQIVGDPDALLPDVPADHAATSEVTTIDLQSAAAALAGAVSGSRVLRSRERRRAGGPQEATLTQASGRELVRELGRRIRGPRAVRPPRRTR